MINNIIPGKFLKLFGKKSHLNELEYSLRLKMVQILSISRLLLPDMDSFKSYILVNSFIEQICYKVT